MRYNCLRTNPYAKMFVVGLLLYLGETVFSNATEETFTVHVKTITGLTIDVSDCKKNDMLSGFMKKFEKVYTKKINDMDYFSKTSYIFIYNSKSIGEWNKQIKDKSLEDLGIDKESTLHVVFRGRNMGKGSKAPNPMVTNKEKKYNITKKK